MAVGDAVTEVEIEQRPRYDGEGDFNEEEFNKVHTGNSLLQKKGTNASNQSKDGK